MLFQIKHYYQKHISGVHGDNGRFEYGHPQSKIVISLSQILIITDKQNLLQHVRFAGDKYIKIDKKYLLLIKGLKIQDGCQSLAFFGPNNVHNTKSTDIPFFIIF